MSQQEQAMHLFIFYLGGNAGKSNIEVHDIQFVIAQTPESAWPALREAWFGDKDKLHIDGYARICWADGYRVTLSTQPSESKMRLFFVNAGAYSPDTLAELHAFDLYVAENAAQAKAKGIKYLLNGAFHQHKDNLKDVDDCMLLEKVGDYYLHLAPDANGSSFRPEWQGYQPV